MKVKIKNKVKETIIKILKFSLRLQSKIIPAHDKLAHFYMGFMYSYITSLFTKGLMVIGVPLFFAITKEIRDGSKDEEGKRLGNVEWLDIMFTILSGVLIYIRQFI